MKITKVDRAGKTGAYRLENDNGMTVQIGVMGAAIERVELPCAGGPVNVCLNFEDPQCYASNGLYAGATVAPVAGRIAGSRFAIGNKIYPLKPNENGATCLHGGAVNASFLEWTVLQAFARDGEARLGLTVVLPEDLEGFPGNRVFSATYRLDNENRLTVDYNAVSDRATYIDMTNHAYFNMSGDFGRSGLEQYLRLPASRYMRCDDRHLPLELAPVEGTPFDFREGKVIRDAFEADPENDQLMIARGLDHGFDVREAAKSKEVLAQLTDPARGRSVRIKSATGRCMVVYSGGYIDGSYGLAGGIRSSEDCAVALECQCFPNAVNRPEFNPRILEEGERYHHRIEYEFVFPAIPFSSEIPEKIY